MPAVRINRPNLFIVGAMKSGTTSLHYNLSHHPEFFMCEPKEPGYFVDDITWPKGEDWYLSLFKGADQRHRWIGESSTDYAKLPVHQGVPERIRSFNPDAKIVYIMRDPFQRIVSHYWFAVRHISTGGLRQDFYTACTTDPHYIDISNYPMQIHPYLDLFGRDQVLLLLFEDLVRNPRSTIKQVLQWLGVENQLEIDIPDKAWNACPKEILGVCGTGILNRIAYSRAWKRISPLVPKRLKTLATRTAYRTIDPNEERANIERLRRELHSQLARQRDEMAVLMCRDLSDVWPLCIDSHLNRTEDLHRNMTYVDRTEYCQGFYPDFTDT